MALLDQLDQLIAVGKSQKELRDHDRQLFEIYEGSLVGHLKNKLRGVFSPNIYEELCRFLIAINVLPKVVDKLTQIYQQDPTRTVQGGKDSDNKLLEWYDEYFDTNVSMNVANEFLNLNKRVLIEPYLDEDGLPRLRNIPGDCFFLWSDNRQNPRIATHVNVILFQVNSLKTRELINVYATYTDKEFLIWDEDKKIYTDLMNDYKMPDGKNRYGAKPFIYVNKSPTRLTPLPDTDTLSMVLELPSQLSWLNFAIGYNCFPIIYGIDVNTADLKRAPNVIWNIKSDKNSEKQPVISSIKPEVDIEESLSFMQGTFGMWLNSKGIRPGAVGQLTADNAESGLAKMVDEGDTTEARKKQVAVFKTAEKKLWDLVFNKMHPVWVLNGEIENRQIFKPTAKVVTNFAEQKPILSRSQILADVKTEMELGIESRVGAMKRANPHMTEQQINEKIAEIDAEKAAAVAKAQESMGDEQPNPDEKEGENDRPGGPQEKKPVGSEKGE